MIHIEKKGESIKVEAVGSLPTLLRELGYATGAILEKFIKDDMTEEKTENFWAKWTKVCRMEFDEIREKQKNGDPGIRQKSYKREPYPWERGN